MKGLCVMSEDKIRENISANIAYYRKKNGYTQKQLAEILGMKNSSVSNWEQGANSPDIEVLFKMCKLFKISVTDLYGCDTVENSSITVSGIEKEIILEYRKSDDIGKALVLRSLGIDEHSVSKGDAEKMA